jgi:hypothetical protein
MQLMHDGHGAARNPSSSSSLVSVTTLLTGGLVPSESVNEMTVLMEPHVRALQSRTVESNMS